VVAHLSPPDAKVPGGVGQHAYDGRWEVGGVRHSRTHRATHVPVRAYGSMVWCRSQLFEGFYRLGLGPPVRRRRQGERGGHDEDGGVVAGEAWVVGPATAANWEAMVYSPV
jgi:hypothetical protein